jgi:hypothetical protein
MEGLGCTAGVTSADGQAVLTVTNSILAYNDGDDLRCEVGTCTVLYTNMTDALWPGVGNISASPVFVDAAGGDYHLDVGSPCINTATPLGAPSTDFERDLRPVRGGYDMGADEFPLRVTVEADVASSLVYTSPWGIVATLDVPVGAVTTTTALAYTPRSSQTLGFLPSGLAFGGRALDLDAYRNNRALSEFSFARPVTLTLRYDDRDAARVLEQTLALYRWTESGWQPIGMRPGETYTLDIENNVLTAYLMGFSRFGQFARAANYRLFLPLLVRNGYG